jgi:hypothetical protein
MWGESRKPGVDGQIRRLSPTRLQFSLHEGQDEPKNTFLLTIQPK